MAYPRQPKPCAPVTTVVAALPSIFPKVSADVQTTFRALRPNARASDPFANLGKLQISVEVSSVIRASPTSFRVAWIQRIYENGSLSTTERWTAILTVVIDPPRDADRLRKNPLGVYVNAINWSK